MKEERNIAVAIILTIVTCGIYGIIWIMQINDEVKEFSGDTNLPSGGVVVLLTLITCGIYGIYWAYQMGKLLETAGQKNNVPISDNSILYIVLSLLGLSIVNYALMQNDLNIIIRSNGSTGEAQA